MKVFIQSFGCQMNKLDTALVSSSLSQAGFNLIESVKDSDVILINTCSVREHAEQRVLSQLGHLKHLKKSQPDIIVGVIGCMAQRLGAELLEHEVVDIVCGPIQIPQIAEMITEVIVKKKKELAVTENILQKTTNQQNEALEQFESVYGTKEDNIPSQAFVRVMRGCNNFCTYCIVPYVRGPEVYRSPDAIIQQIQRLAGDGIRQVTLLGQRINSYKYKKDGITTSLADILNSASDINSIDWIRFVTSYPCEEFFDDIMQAMADCPKTCNYLHMPAQSGSDKILKAMNRRYTANQYLELIERARAIVPGISIAGDFIVGFPGESEKDFQATVDLTEKAQYKNAFIFKYSPRPGTISDKRLADTVSAETKQKRNIELLSVQEKISERLSKQYLNRQVKILVEGLSKKPHLNSAENENHPQLTGRTETDYIVVFNGPVSLAGQFAKVKITKTAPFTLFGELVKEHNP